MMWGLALALVFEQVYDGMSTPIRNGSIV